MSKLQYLSINEIDKIAFMYEGNGYDVNKDDIPLVIMVHDFPEGSSMRCFNNLYGELHNKLIQMGFPTLRFDCRGCGKSDKKPEDFCIETASEDLKAVIKWAQNKKFHKKIAIISAGLGCAVTVMAYDANIMSSLVFLWPVFRPMETPLNTMETLENRNFMTKHDYIRYKGHKVGLLLANELRQMDLVPYLSKIKCATQIQQGTHDEYSSYDHISEIKDHLTGLEDFGVFEDGDHFLTGSPMRKQVVINASFFLDKNKKRQPPADVKEIDRSKIIHGR
jgi:pimeloyl-ACP methyl ester carboxylesterase